jgi:hypothetical protein
MEKNMNKLSKLLVLLVIIATYLCILPNSLRAQGTQLVVKPLTERMTALIPKMIGSIEGDILAGVTENTTKIVSNSATLVLINLVNGTTTEELALFIPGGKTGTNVINTALEEYNIGGSVRGTMKGGRGLLNEVVTDPPIYPADAIRRLERYMASNIGLVDGNPELGLNTYAFNLYTMTSPVGVIFADLLKKGTPDAKQILSTLDSLVKIVRELYKMSLQDKQHNPLGDAGIRYSRLFGHRLRMAESDDIILAHFSEMIRNLEGLAIYCHQSLNETTRTINTVAFDDFVKYYGDFLVNVKQPEKAATITREWLERPIARFPDFSTFFLEHTDIE